MTTNYSQTAHFLPYGEAFKTNPFPMLTEMRREAPICQLLSSDGKRRIWYIARYTDVEAILRDHQRFVSDYRSTLTAEELAQLEPPSLVTRLITENMLNMDGHNHTRLRTLVSKAFTTHRVQQLQPRIQAIADERLDRVIGQGVMDLVDQYALPLPILVILELLGIPTGDREQLQLWCRTLVDPPDEPAGQAQTIEHVQALIAYLGHLFTTRRRTPQDDLISALVQAEAQGDKLSEDELYAMLLLLIIAGYETTVKLIGNSVLTLLQHPAQLARLLAEPTLIGSAMEEVLRYCGPTDLAKMHYVAEDVVVHGHLLRRGEPVRLLVNSANRDEAHFADADIFDSTRKNNKQLGFGLGIHYCLGAPLARLEGQIAITTLLQRLPNLRLAIPVAAVEWDLGSFAYGVKHLPVAWG